MVNYANGKIYTLRSYSRPNLVYVGSTVQLLKERMRHHRSNYKRYVEGKYCYVTSFKIIELGDAYIELHVKCPCSDKEELHKHEGEVIRELDCVNKHIPGRTIKEWREDNKEAIAEKVKKYYDENKEVIKEYKKKYYDENKESLIEKGKKKYTCECGSVIRTDAKSKHMKSKKHQKFINSNITDINVV